MDNLDLDFTDTEVFPGPEFGDQMPGSCSINDFFDESSMDVPRHSCIHTHTCNHPGSNLSHTHTCFHVHTKILSAPVEEASDSAEKSSSTKRPIGNREAVRKYREKKKAQAVSLEDEVVQLRALNQQLMMKLQRHAALEAELTRLKCLLVDIRGRIEGEIGTFPYHRAARVGADTVWNEPQGNFPGAHPMNSCNLRRDGRMSCMQSVMMQGKGNDEGGALDDDPNFGTCEMGNIQCTGSKVILACGRGNAMAAGCSSNAKKTQDGSFLRVEKSGEGGA